MESSSDTKKKHKYFTRSKKKIKDETVEQIAKKSDMKNFNKNIKMVINKKIKTKAIFKKDDSDEYIPSSSDETEDSDVDEYGNVVGLIDYEYDNFVKNNDQDKKNFLNLQEAILRNIRGAYDDEHLKITDIEEYDIEEYEYALKSKRSRDLSDKMDSKETGERYKNRLIMKKYSYAEREYFESLGEEDKNKLLKVEFNILEQENDTIPMRFQVLLNDMPVEIKTKVLNKLNIIKNLDKSNSEYYKIKSWVEGILKIPFGKYLALPISLDDGTSKIKEYLVNVYKKLDQAVYGHNIAKTQLIQIITRWITNPSSNGFVLGIQGPPGNGKTTLVRKGIAKAINKPFAFLTMGGATDASFLEGHSYTYEGSIPGRIVQILGEKHIGCMNPIIYIDELDKISDTPKGHEIHNILCHLTDFSQNDEFHDKYYAGINFDLSKTLFVFSFNDESLINPILRDRMTIIRTKGFDKEDKVRLGRKFLLPELFNDVKMDSELIVFNDDVIKYIIEKYTDEKGVRNFKRCLEKIISKLNVIYLLGDISDMGVTMDIIKGTRKIKFPVNLNKEIVDNLLTSQFDSEDKPTRSHFAMYM